MKLQKLLDGDDAGAGLLVEGFDCAVLQGLYESLDLGTVFITAADGDEVGIGLGGVAGSILDGERVGGLEARIQRVVVVDDGDGALGAVGKQGGNSVSLGGLNGVALGVLDVEYGGGGLNGGVLGQLNQALLLEQKQCAGLVGNVVGNQNGSALLQASRVPSCRAVLGST